MIERGAEILLAKKDLGGVTLFLDALRQCGLGCRVHVARDGADALDYLFRSGPYANHPLGEAPMLVLLDVKLPKVNGIDVLRRLRSDPRFRALPVVFLTSSRAPRDAEEAYRHGANSYVLEPTDSEKFEKTVQKVVLYWLSLNRLLGTRRSAEGNVSGPGAEV